MRDARYLLTPRLRRGAGLALRAMLAAVLLGGIMLSVGTVGQAQEREHRSAVDDYRYVYADLADEVLPSVVTVYVKESLREELDQRRSQIDRLRDLFEQNPGLRDMMPFILPDDGLLPDDPDLYGLGEQFVPTSSGSGIIVSEDGYILTNHHVLTRGLESASEVLAEDTTQLAVVLYDGTEISGKDVKVVYSHPLADLALLKINRNGLKPIKWGDSDALRVGERVAAIGSPLDLKASVTQGIVCAKNRDVLQMSHLIQTDAVINPGSSGGALVNLDGELVGVNRLITSNTGRWQGYGFAIPSNDARWFAEEVMKNGEIAFGYLGVEMAPEGTEKMRLLATLGFDPNQAGVVIEGMPEGSPAERAGLQPGDLVVEVEGRRIRTNTDLLDTIKRQRVGSTVEIIVLRSTGEGEPERHTFRVTLDRRPDETELLSRQDERSGRATPRQPQRDSSAQALGLELEESSNPEGLRIVSVAPGSVAAREGLREGDVITSLNNQPVRNLRDFRRAAEARPEGRAHRLRYVRDGRRGLATLMPPAR